MKNEDAKILSIGKEMKLIERLLQKADLTKFHVGNKVIMGKDREMECLMLSLSMENISQNQLNAQIQHDCRTGFYGYFVIRTNNGFSEFIKKFYDLKANDFMKFEIYAQNTSKIGSNQLSQTIIMNNISHKSVYQTYHDSTFFAIFSFHYAKLNIIDESTRKIFENQTTI